VNVD
jgi:hypothetical protein